MSFKITDLENNQEYLENILTELKDNEELELLVEINFELSHNKFLYLSSREIKVPEGMVQVNEKKVNFDNKDYFFYVFENIAGK